MAEGAVRRVRCREIADGDLPALETLLSEGFPGRPWTVLHEGLARLRRRPVPEGMPRYGYCLEAGGELVGAVLLIAAERTISGAAVPFANISNWYVKPDYRAMAHPLVAMALRRRDVTYTNVTPAPHTWAVVEQQGYTRYCEGLFFAAAILTTPARGAELARFDRQRHAGLADHAMLARHQDMGCEVLVAHHHGTASGYIFRRFRIRGGKLAMPGMFVIHAPERAALVALAGNFGRYFGRRLAPVLVMDANGPVEGLTGRFTARRGRKYFKGPHRPALCDLADTEYAVFGI